MLSFRVGGILLLLVGSISEVGAQEKTPELPRLIESFRPSPLVGSSNLGDYSREKFEPVIQKLKDSLGRIKSIKGKAWINYVNERSGKGSGLAIHQEFSYLKSPESMRYFLSYPKPGIKIESGMTLDQYVPMTARIETPEFTVKGDGFSRQGIESVSIRSATQDSNYGTRIEDIYLTGFQGKTPDRFLEMLESGLKKDKYELRLKVAMNYVELVVWL